MPPTIISHRGLTPTRVPSRRNRASCLLLAAAGSLLALGASAAPAQEGRTAAAAAAQDLSQADRDDAAALQVALPPAGPCVPPPPDLDAWYPFDGNGNDLILGKNATASGQVDFPGAIVLRGASLPAAGSHLTIAPGPVLNQGLGDFSIDLWLYVPKAWLPGPHPVRTLIDKRTSAGGSNYVGYSLYIYNSRLGFQLADGVHTNYGEPASAPPLNAGWYHVAVTIDRDNSKGVVFYRNGAVTGTGNPTARQGNLDNNAPTLIGRNAFGHGGNSMKGAFDELEFFDRVLQQGEVKALYQAGRAGKCKPQ